jgi:oligoribonuclease NrnB/cAMP/cGMP phosphodiesterase (DHH superfamily)
VLKKTISSETKPPRRVHLVSHGPHCLDGVAAAVAIARFYSDSEVLPHFSGNPAINEVVRGLRIEEPLDDQELWITDISWTSPETDAFLRRLANRGLKVFWIDHHRTAIERARSGAIDVPFAHQIVDDRFAASRLVFEYLSERLRAEGRTNPFFERFAHVVRMADDNDRWLHEVPGSWELALTLRAMNGPEAFEDLLTIDESGTYTPRMAAARERVAAEVKRSFEIAEKSRTSIALASGVEVVAAVCDGYPSEIADRWGGETPNAVFVLFDLKSGAISYRRSPDCSVDLSAVAAAFGGGGHPAAAGCEIPELLVLLSGAAGERVAEAIQRLSPKS